MSSIYEAKDIFSHSQFLCILKYLSPLAQKEYIRLDRLANTESDNKISTNMNLILESVHINTCYNKIK